jgi:hypothetical protein
MTLITLITWVTPWFIRLNLPMQLAACNGSLPFCGIDGSACAGSAISTAHHALLVMNV